MQSRSRWSLLDRVCKLGHYSSVISLTAFKLLLKTVMARVLCLFLTFAINANGSESVNLLAISSVSSSLLAMHKRVYEYRWKDHLESFFMFNLGIFSVAIATARTCHSSQYLLYICNNKF